MKRFSGFTLIELMIVVAIVGILAAIAYPSYQNHMAATRRADAFGALMAFANAMERYYTENGKYTDAANGGADTGTPAASVFQSSVPLDGGTAYYNLEIRQATASAFTVRATPVGVQAGDGILELDGTGARRWDRDNGGSFAADGSESCWEKTC